MRRCFRLLKKMGIVWNAGFHPLQTIRGFDLRTVKTSQLFENEPDEIWRFAIHQVDSGNCARPRWRRANEKLQTELVLISTGRYCLRINFGGIRREIDPDKIDYAGEILVAIHCK